MLRTAMSPDDFRDHAEWISGAVQSMLAHYFDPKLDGQTLTAALGDWIEVLEPYSRDCIGEARRRWVAREDRRPTPAAIKRLCDRVAAGL